MVIGNLIRNGNMSIGHCTVEERKGLERFTEGVRRLFPQRVKKITLFGSKAAGVPTAESDIDILVIVDRKDREITEAIFDLGHETLLESDCLVNINPIVISESYYLGLLARERRIALDIEAHGIIL